MAEIKQFIPLADKNGMLKNISELLQEIRDGNITSLFLGYTRKDESMRTYWYNSDDIAKFIYLLEQIKYDFISGRFEDNWAKSYGED